MKEIKWIAGNGQEAKVIHLTEEQNIADHTVMNKCDEIEIRLGGDIKIYQGTEDGLIKCMGVKIRIPEEHKEAVMAMINGVDQRREERENAISKADTDYNKHYNNTKNKMGE